MADSSGGEMKRERERSENGVTNHPATTIKRDTLNETLDQILPSKSGAGVGTGWGGSGTKLEKSRREKRFISVVLL